MMVEHSSFTIADALRQVFINLDNKIPISPSHNSKTLFAAWSEVLGGDGRSEQAILASVMEVYASLDKLEMQVRVSTLLDDHLRDTALTTTASFKPLFTAVNFNTPAANYKSNCSKGMTGNLAFVGMSIKPEFSQPKLMNATQNEIKNALTEVRVLLASADLPVDLRANLTSQIEAMLWWLEHPDMMNVQDMFEKAMLAVIVARQMDGKVITPEAKEKSKSIFDKLGSVGSLLAKLLNFSISNVDKIEHAGHAVTQAIGYTPST